MTERGRCDAANVTDLIGRRVVVRHRVGDKQTDAVGELSADGADLVVQTRRGPVRVARSAVTAVRAVPPAPPRRASLTAIARLEELCADAWPAYVDERLGAWRLRAAGGFTARANSALAIGDPGMPTEAALAAVRRFAGRHGIAPRVQAPVGSPWDKAVAAQGWVLDVGHAAGSVVSVQVADLAAPDHDRDGPRTGPTGATAYHPAVGPPIEVGATADSAADGLAVDVGAPGDAWWRLVLGGPPSPAQRHVLGGAGALTIADAHGLVGAGRVVVVADHLHVSVLTVDPALRRRGHGTALLAAAARWGRGHGARWGVLQVAVHNTAALALYARSGWTEHHRYRYLVPSGG
jgi:ribosomal protein S18 acetylase RimI-like enzyme